MAKNKILFIVEGESDELKFLKKLLKTCRNKQEYEVYSCKENIHMLAQELYKNYPEFDEDDIDIKLILRSITNDAKRNSLLTQKFKDIYMVFDYEVQHDHPHFDTVKKMLMYFNDSTTRGKLYINYPMMQSFKHFYSLPDSSFRDRKVHINDVKRYKESVADYSGFTDLTRYNALTFYSLATHHIRKGNYILSGKYIEPTIEEYLNWDQVDIFNYQCDMVKMEQNLYVLNTSIYMLIDFAPKAFFDFIKRHALELQI